MLDLQQVHGNRNPCSYERGFNGSDTLERKVTPTHIHMSLTTAANWGEPLCGAERQTWKEECMSDSFAKTLPRCPNCLDIVGELSYQTITEPKVIPDVKEEKEAISFISLSMYLE